MLGCNARRNYAHSILASCIELHVIGDETIVLLGHHSMVCVVALDAVANRKCRQISGTCSVKQNKENTNEINNGIKLVPIVVTVTGMFVCYSRSYGCKVL